MSQSKMDLFLFFRMGTFYCNNSNVGTNSQVYLAKNISYIIQVYTTDT